MGSQGPINIFPWDRVDRKIWIQMIHPFAKIAICLFPAAILALGWKFHKTQNRNANVGGAISPPKSVWLAYTVLTWFLMPIVFAAFFPLSKPFQWVISLHLISWWGRGVIELIIIYKWFNWKPIYGMSHDIFQITILSAGSAYLLTLPKLTSAEKIVLVYFLGMICTTFAELGFAYVFNRIRGAGQNKVYFASQEPQWRRVNQVTTVIVTLALIHLIVLGAWTLSI